MVYSVHHCSYVKCTLPMYFSFKEHFLFNEIAFHFHVFSQRLNCHMMWLYEASSANLSLVTHVMIISAVQVHTPMAIS